MNQTAKGVFIAIFVIVALFLVWRGLVYSNCLSDCGDLPLVSKICKNNCTFLGR